MKVVDNIVILERFSLKIVNITFIVIIQSHTTEYFYTTFLAAIAQNAFYCQYVIWSSIKFAHVSKDYCGTFSINNMECNIYSSFTEQPKTMQTHYILLSIVVGRDIFYDVYLIYDVLLCIFMCLQLSVWMQFKLTHHK